MEAPEKIYVHVKTDEVIDFLREAKNHTYSSEDTYYLSRAIEVLLHMKASGKFKD